MNKSNTTPSKNHLQSKQIPLKLEMELPPHGLETCLACKIMMDLRIQGFNNIPGNCRAQQQEDFWCSLLHLDEWFKRMPDH